MSILYIEKGILDVIKNLKEPSVTQIKRRCGLGIATIKAVCKKLVDDGYLKDVQGYKYCLTDKGVDYSLRLAKRINIDDDIVKDIANQVAEQISKQVAGKRFIPGQESEIAIKTDYDFPIEDETKGLKSNINKIGVKLEREKSDIDKSVDLFKNIKNLRRGR